jgi:hypothetical protein
LFDGKIKKKVKIKKKLQGKERMMQTKNKIADVARNSKSDRKTVLNK